MDIFYIRWFDRANSRSHGTMNGAFLAQETANATASALAECDRSRYFVVEHVPVFNSVPASWLAVFNQGGSPKCAP